MVRIDYIVAGDYLLPAIKLSDPPDAPPIGRYGWMRKMFLKEHRSIRYNSLLLSERLYPHLRTVDDAASARIDAIMSDLLRFNPAPDKAENGLAWATHMTETRRTAEKMMLDEIVYA